MWRNTLLLLAAVVAAPSGLQAQSPVDHLIPQPVAERHNLHRSWFTQIDMDVAEHRVTHASYHRGLLMLMTSSGRLHVLDANTGATLWVGEVGAAGHPNVPANASDRVVVAINGSLISVFERGSGNLRWTHRLRGVPSAKPSVGDGLVLIPTETGMLEGYDLLDPERPPAPLSTAGKTIVDPLTTTTSAAFPTTVGSLFVVYPDSAGPLFNLDAGGVIPSTPGYCPPWILAGSLNGYVYAVHQTTGIPAWRFSAGEPIRATPAAFSKTVTLGGRVEVGDKFSVTIGDETVTVVATTKSATITAADLVYALNHTKFKNFSKITAVTSMVYDGTIESMDENRLTYTGVDGKKYQFEVGPTVAITINGKAATTDDLRPGMQIKVRLDTARKTLLAVSDVPQSPVAVITLSNDVVGGLYVAKLVTLENDDQDSDGQLFAINDDAVYVFPEAGGLHSLSAETGQSRWYTPNAGEFMAASPTRLYLRDRRGQMIVLDRASGVQIDALSLPDALLHFANVYSDRIILVSEFGVVQSLHERELAQPVIYEAPAIVVAATRPARKPGTPAATTDAEAPGPAADEDDPFAEEPAAEDEGLPVEEPAAEDDPFAEGAAGDGAAAEDDPFAEGGDDAAMPAEEADPFAE